MEYALITLAALLLFALGGGVKFAVRHFIDYRRFVLLRRHSESLGFVATPSGRADLERLPTRLGKRGTHQRVPNAIMGIMNGIEVVMFDLEYRRSNKEASFKVTRHNEDFFVWLTREGVRHFLDTFTRVTLTCAIIRVPGVYWPDLVIDSVGAAAKRSPQDAAKRSIDFESDAFNKHFHVTGGSRKFAFEAIDARLMAWLLDHGQRLDIELCEDVLLVVGDRLAPEKWLDHGLLATRLLATMPSLAFTEYGGSKPVVAAPHEHA